MASPEVTVYCTKFCVYCMRARSLLNKKGVEYNTIDIANYPDLREEMETKSGRTSVPQIFINDHHVGGYDDLAAANRSGELDKLLEGTSVDS